MKNATKRKWPRVIIVALIAINFLAAIVLFAMCIMSITRSITTEYGKAQKQVVQTEAQNEEDPFKLAKAGNDPSLYADYKPEEEPEKVVPLEAIDQDQAEAEATAEVDTEPTEAKPEEFAYSNNFTQEDADSVADYFKEAPDVDTEEYFDFIDEYKEYLQDYDLGPNGVLLIPLSDESLRQTDDERPLASVNMGLNKHPINDAIAFPFSLTEEQIKKVIAAKAGQKVDFSEEEIKELRIELFKELAENPVLFESWMKLVTDQKIGQYAKVIESWPAGARYIELNNIARDLEPYTNGTDPYADIRGKGMNIWLTKVNGKTYTTAEYQQYVLDIVYLLLPAETDVEVLTAKAGDHYCLVPGEKNSVRFAQPANYKETLASLVFKIYTKDGKVAIKFGANLRDKRPEVLNYTVTKKPTVKKTTTSKPPVVTTTTTDNPGTPNTPSTPGTPNNPPDDPRYSKRGDGS